MNKHAPGSGELLAKRNKHLDLVFSLMSASRKGPLWARKKGDSHSLSSYSQGRMFMAFAVYFIYIILFNSWPALPFLQKRTRRPRKVSSGVKLPGRITRGETEMFQEVQSVRCMFRGSRCDV